MRPTPREINRKELFERSATLNARRPQESRWSDILDHLWSADQPIGVHSRGVAALVLDPIIDGYRLSKVLMDGGSSLNLIYEDTLQKMQFDRSRIQPSRTTFKGIVPGKEARCTGKVMLDVVFGTPNNYRTEELIFDIVPIPKWLSRATRTIRVC